MLPRSQLGHARLNAGFLSARANQAIADNGDNIATKVGVVGAFAHGLKGYAV
jgi:hypothetical protein